MDQSQRNTKWCQFYWRSHGCRWRELCDHAHSISEFRGDVRSDRYAQWYRQKWHQADARWIDWEKQWPEQWPEKRPAVESWTEPRPEQQAGYVECIRNADTGWFGDGDANNPGFCGTSWLLGGAFGKRWVQAGLPNVGRETFNDIMLINDITSDWNVHYSQPTLRQQNVQRSLRNVAPSDAEWHGAAGSEPLRCNCGAIVPPGRRSDHSFCRECTLPFDHTWQYSRGADRGQPCFPKGTIVTSTIQWLRLLLCVSRYHLLSVLSPQESCDLQARPLGHALTVLLAQPWQLEVIPTKSNTEPTIEPINTEVNT